MKWFESRILWGSLLVLGGAVILLENLGIVDFGGLFWALLFALGGVVFLSIFFQNRLLWWALIPGVSLLGVGLLIALGELLPNVSDNLGGTIFLGSIAVAFLVIYFLDRKNWWALIPAGVLLTLAAVAGLDQILTGEGTGGIFFLGMGATFGLLALLPNPKGPMRWAWIPAGVLALMGFLFLAAAENLFNYIWPAVLILGGGFLMLRGLLPRQR